MTSRREVDIWMSIKAGKLKINEKPTEINDIHEIL
jgi:hypothetical protein